MPLSLNVQQVQLQHDFATLIAESGSSEIPETSEVNHKFMCEKEHFKQQFLLTMFDGPDYADTCLFTDATTCFSAPQCARHPSRSCVPCLVLAVGSSQLL